MAITLNKFTTGEELSADVLNRPLSQLESAVNALQTTVAGITTQSRVVVTGVLCADVVNVGDVVYIDGDGLANKALAVWAQTKGAQGEILPDQRSNVTGVVINKDGAAVDIISVGTLGSEHAAVKTALVGSTPQPGTYYLSSTAPGKVTSKHAANYFQVPVVQVDRGGNVIVRQVAQSAGQHIHKHYLVPLDDGWSEINGVRQYVNGVLEELAYYNVADCVVTYDGAITDQFTLSIVDGQVVLAVAVANWPGTEGRLEVFTTVPFPFDPPTVRAVRTTSPRLRAEASNGIVTLSMGKGVPGVHQKSAIAISAFNDDDSYNTTPVISGIKGDATISVHPLPGGEVSLSAGYGEGHTIYPAMVSMDGTTITEVQSQLMYIFPAIDRQVGLVGSIPIDSPPEGVSWSMYPFVTVAAPGVGNYTASFKVATVFAPTPTVSVGSGVALPIPSSVSLPGSPNLNINVTNGNMASARIDAAISVTSAGTLTVRVYATTQTAYTVCGFGVIVNPLI